ncbi:Golgi apparatus membrane protein tvp23 [Blastocladiella emersonii ATCC 22665]|nr:Golgi apparatus membrane protein tvp23 [Blastocladiella emersonii ATCC 22665]
MAETRVDMSGAMGSMTPAPAAAGGGSPPGAPGEPARQQTMFERSSHPVALFFHLLFRTAALLTYLLGYYVTDNFILVFVLCVLFLAFDFWTVKNVSGRLLVGLRWWNEVSEDGATKWVFESRENNQPNPADAGVFWTTLYAFSGVWAVFAVLQILHPSWFCITAVALSLNMANVLGYTKCDKDAKKRFAGYGQSVLGSSMGQSVVGTLLTRGTGGMFRGLFGGSR